MCPSLCLRRGFPLFPPTFSPNTVAALATSRAQPGQVATSCASHRIASHRIASAASPARLIDDGKRSDVGVEDRQRGGRPSTVRCVGGAPPCDRRATQAAQKSAANDGRLLRAAARREAQGHRRWWEGRAIQARAGAIGAVDPRGGRAPLARRPQSQRGARPRAHAHRARAYGRGAQRVASARPQGPPRREGVVRCARSRVPEEVLSQSRAIHPRRVARQRARVPRAVERVSRAQRVPDRRRQGRDIGPGSVPRRRPGHGSQLLRTRGHQDPIQPAQHLQGGE